MGEPSEFDAQATRAVRALSAQRPLGAHPSRQMCHRPQTAARIMAIDDDRTVLRGVARMLRGTSCSLHAYDSPLQALEDIGTHDPALVLVDLHMPRLDGLEFLRLAAGRVNLDARRVYLQSSIGPRADVLAAALSLGARVIDKRLLFDREWLASATRDAVAAGSH